MKVFILRVFIFAASKVAVGKYFVLKVMFKYINCIKILKNNTCQELYICKILSSTLIRRIIEINVAGFKDRNNFIQTFFKLA